MSCDGVEVGPSEFCAAVRVANPTVSAAQLVGWVDFDKDEQFNDSCTTTDGVVTSDCERSAPQVRIGNRGLATLDSESPACLAASDPAGTLLGSTDFTSGNIPANCEGVVVVTWDLSSATEVTTETTYARLRITTDADRGFFAAAGFTEAPNEPLPNGYQGSGEVEDEQLDAGTLPVSIHSFDSTIYRRRPGDRVGHRLRDAECRLFYLG